MPVQHHTEDGRQMGRTVPRRRCRWFARPLLQASLIAKPNGAWVTARRRSRWACTGTFSRKPTIGPLKLSKPRCHPFAQTENKLDPYPGQSRGNWVFRVFRLNAKRLKSKDGRVAEWFKAPVLKTGVP